MEFTLQFLQLIFFGSLLAWVGYEIWQTQKIVDNVRLTNALRKTYLAIFVAVFAIAFSVFLERIYPYFNIIRWIGIDGCLSYIALLVRARRNRILKQNQTLITMSGEEKFDKVIAGLFKQRDELIHNAIHNSN